MTSSDMERKMAGMDGGIWRMDRHFAKLPVSLAFLAELRLMQIKNFSWVIRREYGDFLQRKRTE